MTYLTRISIPLLLLLLSVQLMGQDKKVSIKDIRVQNPPKNYGIEGQQAPELDISLWVDAQGKETDPIYLKDNKGKFKVIYCFQAWCPGCHTKGLPALKEMTDALEGNDKVLFLALQTVFEGSHANTYERMLEIQKQYELEIPFGHDTGDASTRNRSSTLTNYNNGGTPWFILIDEDDKVIFNDFHLDTEKTIEYLKQL